MVQPAQDIRLNVQRWRVLLGAAGFAAGLVIELLSYFVWTPSRVTWHPWVSQNPATTIFFAAVLLATSAFVALGVYQTFRRDPSVHLTTSKLVYHPLPFYSRTVSGPMWTMSLDFVGELASLATCGSISRLSPRARPPMVANGVSESRSVPGCSAWHQEFMDLLLHSIPVQ